MLLSRKQTESIANRFPFVQIAHENVTSHKVYKSDAILAIPQGTKSFAWFTSTQINNKPVCLIIDLFEQDKKICSSRIVQVCFKNKLELFTGEGTLLYGTTFVHQCQRPFFAIEDIFLHQGVNVCHQNWGQKFMLMRTLLKSNLRQISTIFDGAPTMVFGMPLMSKQVDHFISQVARLKYPVSSVQFRMFERKNQYLCMDYAAFAKPKPRLAFPDTVFTVKPDLTDDIYHLYNTNNNNTNNNNNNNKDVFVGVALIPDYTTSVMMNNLFRNAVTNLDALEESDDEMEFEKNDEDLFLHKSIDMVCTFNHKFKKWHPVQVFSH